MNKAVLTAAALAACAAFNQSSAFAQLRVVTMNPTNSGSSFAGPRSGMDTILSAIGSSVLKDPNAATSTGIAKPIDILCLQEVFTPNTTGAGYATLMNNLYGTNTYKYGLVAGGTTGSGTQGVIYNSAKVELIGEKAFGTTSDQGLARQVLRYQFRPVGYDANADVYIYNSHYKSSNDSASRRLVEANAIRADADALGASKNIIYLGDYNVFKSSEAGYQKLLSAGNGQAVDPINKPGDWDGASGFKNIHTQTPYDSTIGQPGFDSGGMTSRFDIQLISNNLNDRKGLAYIPTSYQCFGNNGTHIFGRPLNTGTGAAPNVLRALSSILDHLPVGADYQLPARMAVNTSAVPERVIVGANVGLTAIVSNTAPVASNLVTGIPFANGADTLMYTLTGSGDVSGTASGNNVVALSSGPAHPLAFSTVAPGVKNGSINVSSTSEAVANGTQNQSVSTTVLAHGTPSFSSRRASSTASIDFGIKGRGLPGASEILTLANLPDASGFTAKIDLDSIVGAGNTSALRTNAVEFLNLAPGGENSFTASIDTSTNGFFDATYTLNFSDENILGATSLGSLTLTLHGIVATPGDANLDGRVNFDDYARIDNGFNNHLTGWQNGDFDGNGRINFDDYALIDSSFNGGGQGFSVPAVPEPSMIGIVAVGAITGLCRRRRLA